jgi:Zn-dependent peptidase ImmA (M78 family)
MKRLSISEAEGLAKKLRADIGIGNEEPINAKTMLRQLHVLTMYRPLSEEAYGISVKSGKDGRFMLINSKTTRGRQHFTIGHELYHLLYDEHPTPHLCVKGESAGTERDANLFSSALLMPEDGLRRGVSAEETRTGRIELATVLRLEQLYGVSRSALLYRMKDLRLIDEQERKRLADISIKESAKEYGYDLSLYESGNDGVVIGDFGEKARRLFEMERISEGHYVELLNMIHP